jgi:hypothetical protein
LQLSSCPSAACVCILRLVLPAIKPASRHDFCRMAGIDGHGLQLSGSCRNPFCMEHITSFFRNLRAWPTMLIDILRLSSSSQARNPHRVCL